MSNEPTPDQVDPTITPDAEPDAVAAEAGADQPRPPEDAGRPFGASLPRPGDYGAAEAEQRRVQGRPREEAP